MDYNGFVYINSVSIVVRKGNGERGGGGLLFLVRFEVSVMIMYWFRKFYFVQIYDFNSKYYFCYELVI